MALPSDVLPDPSGFNADTPIPNESLPSVQFVTLPQIRPRRVDIRPTTRRSLFVNDEDLTKAFLAGAALLRLALNSRRTGKTREEQCPYFKSMHAAHELSKLTSRLSILPVGIKR